MATLMTIRPDQPATRLTQATFKVLATEAPVINPAGILPGELQVLADKVMVDQMETPTVYPAAALLLHLMQVWGMGTQAAIDALHMATDDGEHLIVHV